MSRSLPDKWLPYKPYGEVIEGTKIVAFKVPLKESVAKNLQPDQRFTPKMLLEAIPRIKYVIDLTNTDRYYDQREFTNAGIKHLKILVPGRLIPPTELIKRFFKAMDDFMATSEADELIGVHCTHGVNRTGYFICRYLIQQLGWESQNAMTAFKEARGYPIERDVFVNDLNVTPRGEKLDTSEITLDDPVMPIRGHKRIPKRHNPMGPPGFHPSRRGFPNGRPFPPHHEHFGFGPPAFNPAMPPMPPRPPMPPMPPMPPPHGVPYGPRPHRYGPPPGRGFPNVGFPPRMPPGPPRMPMPGGPPRLPGPPGPPGPLGPPCPPSHVGLNWHPSHPMGPRGPPGPGPRLPHGPPKPMPPLMKGGPMRNSRKKWDPQNAVGVRNMAIKRINKPVETPVPVHIDDFIRDQDFTADTFEENLTAGVIPGDRVPAVLMTGPRRRNKGRFNNRVSRGE